MRNVHGHVHGGGKFKTLLCLNLPPELESNLCSTCVPMYVPRYVPGRLKKANVSPACGTTQHIIIHKLFMRCTLGMRTIHIFFMCLCLLVHESTRAYLVWGFYLFPLIHPNDPIPLTPPHSPALFLSCRAVDKQKLKSIFFPCFIIFNFAFND